MGIRTQSQFKTTKPPREILKKSHAHRSKKDYKRKPKHTKGKPND